MCDDRAQDNVHNYSGTSVSGKPEWYVWFLAILWPFLGVGFVWLDWSVDRSFSSTIPFIGHASLVFASACVGAYTLLAARSAGHQVIFPEVKQKPYGVLVVADSRFDPFIASIILRMGCAVASLGLATALTLGSSGSDRRSVTLAFSVAFFAVGIIFLVQAVRLWVLRHACQQYPGDIELSPEGIRQRYGNCIVCVSWRNIEGWRGASETSLGEFRDLWDALSGREVYYSASHEPQVFSSIHRQRFKLILNPVSDVYAIHALLDAAQENPDWARELFRSHDRAERVLNILTASGCEDALYEAHSWGVGEYDSEDGCNGLREGV